MKEFYETFRDSGLYPVYWEEKHENCPPHFHSSLEFTYVTEGRVHALLNGQSFTIRKGELFLVSSCAAHSYYDSESASSLLLIVPLDFIPLYSSLLSKKIFTQCVSRDALLNREAFHCLRMILSQGECSGGAETLIKSYIYVLIGMAIRQIGLKDASEGGFFPKEILYYLQNHYLSSVTLESLAQTFGYSKFRFSKLFNKGMGCSLTRYVDSLRSRHAANLLRETDLPLLEIAFSSGFSSARTFYRSFKDCFGMTPSQFRKSLAQTPSSPP